MKTGFVDKEASYVIPILLTVSAALLIANIVKGSEASNSSNGDPGKLSPHFTLNELLQSSAANSNGYSEQYSPSVEVVNNLRLLAINVLEPVRSLTNQPLHISSGYRCARTNTVVGGVNGSQHLTGEAADINTGSSLNNQSLFNTIKASNILFDQLILEKDCVHISYNKSYNRRQAFIQ